MNQNKQEQTQSCLQCGYIYGGALSLHECIGKIEIPTTKPKEQELEQINKSLSSLKTSKTGAVSIELHQHGHIEHIGGNCVEDLIPALKELLKACKAQAIKTERNRIVEIVKIFKPEYGGDDVNDALVDICEDLLEEIEANT